MRARVVELRREQGFGKVELEDGRLLPFDVSASVVGVPDVGASVDVQLGKSRLGGDKVTRLEVVPSWEPSTFPFLFLRRIDGGDADIVYLRDDGLARVSEPSQKLTGNGKLQLGDTGFLVEERKRGFDSATETRVVRFWREDVPVATRTKLMEAFRAALEEEWEDWDHPDGAHTSAERESLARNVYLGRELGLDVEKLLSIRGYPEEDLATGYDDVRPEVDRWVRLSRPAELSRHSEK